MKKPAKPKREEALRIGQRMERAMKAEGLNWAEVCSTLGWQSGTLYRYFNGDIMIPLDKLRLYATLVRRPVEWFTSEEDDRMAQDVGAVLLRILGRVIAGRHIDEAFDLETGQPLGWSLTDREQARAAEPALRRELERLAGRPLDQLSPEESQQLLRSLMQPPDEGHRGGSSTTPPRQPPIQ